MRILITGAAGFIGSHVADAALAAGHDVRGLDSLAPAVHDGRPGYWPAAAELVTADVRDPGAVRRALAGVDAVCHQAALVGLGVDLSDLPPYCDVNVTAPPCCWRRWARLGVPRLVLASSMVVYGEGRYDAPSTGRCARLPGPRADLSGAGSSRAAPTCGADLRTGHGRRVGPAGPAQRLRRQQGRPGAAGRRVGGHDRRRGRRAALPQRLRPPDAARHPVLRRGRDLPLRAGGGPAAAGVRGRRPAPRLRARRATSRRPTCSP